MILRDIVFFDAETTGTNPDKDRIVQLATLKVSPDLKKAGQMKKILVNPEMSIPEEATAIHGITDEMVWEAPTFKRYSAGLREYFRDCDVCGYNSNRFDVLVLSAEFARCGYAWPMDDVRLLDAYSIYATKEKRDLAAAYRFYCDKDLTDAHDAGADIMATFEVFKAQVNGYEDLAGMDAGQLHNFCGGDKRVDLAGKLYRDAQGDVRYAFGPKTKDKLVTDDLGFAQWMLGGDFPEETKKHLKRILGL